MGLVVVLIEFGAGQGAADLKRFGYGVRIRVRCFLGGFGV